MAIFKTLWGNNEDLISLQYAGHLSEMKENLLERSESIERYNFVSRIFSEDKYQENYKNHCIKLLLQVDTRGIIKFNVPSTFKLYTS